MRIDRSSWPVSEGPPWFLASVKITAPNRVYLSAWLLVHQVMGGLTRHVVERLGSSLGWLKLRPGRCVTWQLLAS